MGRIHRLIYLYKKIRGGHPPREIGEVGLCMGIMADNKELIKAWAELYSGWVLEDNPNDPIEYVLNLYEEEMQDGTE